jgi:hypothetical protein
MSDSIAPDIPMEWREARIAKLKKGLTDKFGADLGLPESL